MNATTPDNVHPLFNDILEGMGFKRLKKDYNDEKLIGDQVDDKEERYEAKYTRGEDRYDDEKLERRMRDE